MERRNVGAQGLRPQGLRLTCHQAVMRPEKCWRPNPCYNCKMRLEKRLFLMNTDGTLALDGILLDGVICHTDSLRSRLNIHLLTADTHGGQGRLPSGRRGLKRLRACANETF